MTVQIGPSQQPLPISFVRPWTTRIECKGMRRRTQMKPVAARATFWLTESFSAGRARSFRPAATRPHLAIGAQKKMVLVGVSGWPISVTSHYVTVTGLCQARPTGSAIHMPRIQEHIISVCRSRDCPSVPSGFLPRARARDDARVPIRLGRQYLIPVTPSPSNAFFLALAASGEYCRGIFHNSRHRTADAKLTWARRGGS